MSDTYDENIDQKVVEEFQDVIVEVFQLLRTFGIEELHVGGLMRMLGVSTEVAELYDDHVMVASDLNSDDETSFELDLDDISLSKIMNNSSTKLH